MSNITMSDLANLARTLLDKQTKGQEFMLADVYRMTSEAYEQYREDAVIKQVAFVIERMAEKSAPGTTISQSEITDIYNDLVRLSSETKFKKVLGHLLLEDKTVTSNKSQEFINTRRVDANDSEIKTEDLVDKNLSTALNSVFGTSNGYDSKMATKGEEYVRAELNSIGVKGADVKLMGGDKNTLVYAADVETRKGKITVAIPIDTSNGKLLFPSTFVADTTLQELTADNLQNFVSHKIDVGDFSIPDVKSIVSSVSKISGHSGGAPESEFKKVTAMFKEADTMAMSTPNLYADRKEEEIKPEINTIQKVEMPKELAHLANDFEDDMLEAVSSFGKDAVETGRLLVARELISAGFKNAQVKYGGDASDSVIYLASINTPKGPVEVEVPVEMRSTADKHVPLMPTYFAYDGMIDDFTAVKLQRFAVSLPAPSSRSVTFSSVYEYMKLPELKDEILKSVASHDYIECETILSHIGERFNEEDYKNAVADYHYLLMEKNRIESQEQHKCSKMIPAGKGSIYPRCGHFGVPMHEVIAGPDGKCMLKKSVEREKLNPQEEGGANISTSKIILT